MLGVFVNKENYIINIFILCSSSNSPKITSLTINLPVESIKSEKSSMDKVAYKTLKTDKFKTIKYVLKSAAERITATQQEKRFRHECRVCGNPCGLGRAGRECLKSR